MHIIRILKALPFKALAVVLFVAYLAPMAAYAANTNYDMNRFLNQGHPFALQPAPVPAQALQPQTITTPGSYALPRARVVPHAPMLAANPSPRSSDGLGGILSEVRVGALMHDVGPFSSSKESGIDSNLEFLFTSPDLLDVIWSPRPMLGISFNSKGDTSQAYMGLEWEKKFWGEWFASFSFGGMVHDGHLVGELDGRTGEKSLGCRMLFREAIDFGYRFGGKHAVMLHLDHSSNASLCKKNTTDGSATGRHTVTINEGLEAIGIRYGYSF